MDDILRSIDAFRTYNSNREEEAILASWNKLCVEIIKKNLLPVTLNLERVIIYKLIRSKTNIRPLHPKELASKEG